MRADLFDAWVDALQKPHIWRQGIGELESPDGCFCALGLLLRIDNGRFTKGLRRSPEQTVVRYRLDGVSMTGYPSYEYRQRHGLDTEFLDWIINMNDAGVTFPEIAAHLKEKRNAIVNRPAA